MRSMRDDFRHRSYNPSHPNKGHCSRIRGLVLRRPDLGRSARRRNLQRRN